MLSNAWMCAQCSQDARVLDVSRSMLVENAISALELYLLHSSKNVRCSNRNTFAAVACLVHARVARAACSPLRSRACPPPVAPRSPLFPLPRAACPQSPSQLRRSS